MAWLDNATIILREIIGDNTTNVEYSDSRLQEVLFSAAYIVNYEGIFGYDVDVVTQVLSVTPANDFITLTIFKAVAMIACGEYRQAAKNAINIKDGPSAIDMKGVAEAKKTLCDQFSKKYESAVNAKLSADASNYYAIVGPFNYDGVYYGRDSGHTCEDMRSY